MFVPQKKLFCAKYFQGIMRNFSYILRLNAAQCLLYFLLCNLNDIWLMSHNDLNVIVLVLMKKNNLLSSLSVQTFLVSLFQLRISNSTFYKCQQYCSIKKDIIGCSHMCIIFLLYIFLYLFLFIYLFIYTLQLLNLTFSFSFYSSKFHKRHPPALP